MESYVKKFTGKDKVRIYYKESGGLDEKFNYKIINKNYKKGYFDQDIIHFIPHTMISRIPYTLNLRFNLISDKKIFNNLNFNSSLTAIINSLSLLIKLLYMIFPIYFFLRKFKII